MKVKCFLLFLFIFTFSVCFGETEKIPEPYGIDEFAQWQKDLRRFEIISFGALPFVSLLTFWGYDMIRAIVHSGDPAYYPWPLKRSDIAAPLTENEQKYVFFTAMGLSVGVALIDYAVRAIIRNKKNKLLKREAQINESAIELVPLDASQVDEKGFLKTEVEN